MNLLEQQKFDDTLLVGLNEVLQTRPDARTTFDETILEKMEKLLSTRIADLDAAVTEGVPEREKRAAIVQKIRDALENARQQKKQGADLLHEAKFKIREGELAVKLCEEAAAKLQNQSEALAARLDSAEKRLQASRDGPLAAFRRVIELDGAVEEERAAPENV